MDVRRFSSRDACGVVDIWRESLLLHGHTSKGRSFKQSDVVKLVEDKQQQLIRLHQRKVQARQDGVQPQRRQTSSWMPTSQEIRQQRARTRTHRMWMCLVAEDAAAEGTVAGYLIVSLSRPMALLPPPFPTTAAFQLHIDALAVAPQFRRRGVATSLLASAERLARRWHHPQLWLHVGEDNAAALRTYQAAGFSVVQRKLFTSPPQLLMCKAVPPRRPPQAPAGLLGRSRPDGVYVWGSAE